MSAWCWRRILLFLHTHFPSFFEQVGVSEEWLHSLSEKVAVRTSHDIATQTVHPIAEVIQSLAGSWAGRSQWASVCFSPVSPAAAAAAAGAAGASAVPAFNSSNSGGGFSMNRVAGHSAFGSPPVHAPALPLSSPPTLMSHGWSGLWNFLVRFIQA